MKLSKLRYLTALNLSLLIIGYLAPGVVWAQEQFDYNYIISDNDLTDYTSLTFDQIQAFLVSKNSTLADYVDPTTRLSAAQVIYQSAQDFQINPKFLLALLQKEQSLVEHPLPQPNQYDWATGYAVCDSCTTTDPDLQKFKGFYNQVYNAAKRIRTVYLADLETKGMTTSGYGPGLTKLVDGLPITPANNATAVVYTYTPHLEGNKLLFQIWQRFFARTYPDGTLLKAEGENDVWLIENGFRRKFANQSVYLSRYSDFSRLITVNRTDLLKYPEGQEIKFANYSYLRVPSGTVYLLVDDQLRGFASAEALRRVGVNPEEIIEVAAEDIKNYPQGQPITIESVYPLGALLQDKTTGGVYWVQDGQKYPLWSREIMTANFPHRRPLPTTPQELANYQNGAPLKFRDGELIKAHHEPTVYLISHGQRRPFKSAEDFLALGFAWENVITTTPAAVSLHELGEPLTVNF